MNSWFKYSAVLICLSFSTIASENIFEGTMTADPTFYHATSLAMGRNPLSDGALKIPLKAELKLNTKMNAEFSFAALPEFNFFSGAVAVTTRLFESIFTPTHSVHRSTCYGGLRLLTPEFPVRLRFELGHYYRTYKLKIFSVPFLDKDTSDHDWAAHFEIIASLNNWQAAFAVSTLEPYGTIFRLNNPFAELRITHQVVSARFDIYLRQHVLLGFGNLGATAIGFRWFML